MARFSVTATRGEVTGRPERPPDKFLGPRSQMVGFEKVNRPKGGEARISESRECNLKAAVGREGNLKVQTLCGLRAGFLQPENKLSSQGI